MPAFIRLLIDSSIVHPSIHRFPGSQPVYAGFEYLRVVLPRVHPPSNGHTGHWARKVRSNRVRNRIAHHPHPLLIGSSCSFGRAYAFHELEGMMNSLLPFLRSSAIWSDMHDLGDGCRHFKICTRSASPFFCFTTARRGPVHPVPVCGGYTSCPSRSPALRVLFFSFSLLASSLRARRRHCRTLRRFHLARRVTGVVVRLH